MKGTKMLSIVAENCRLVKDSTKKAG